MNRIAVAPKIQLNKSVLTYCQDVAEAACLPLPLNYRLPEHGALGEDCFLAMEAIESCNSVFISGAPGTGKDALVHAFCACTRRPSVILSIRPGVDIESWFFTRGLTNGGTFWEEGALLKALRDGYKTESGKVVPYLVLISDLDRATKNQAEALRLILDSITGRVQGPDGRVHKVLDGTKIVATANSSGSGDTSGRCISSNPIDASILDRFEVKIRFNAMDWRDEVEILKQEFPQLTQESLMVVGNVVAAVRAAAKQGLQFDLSHRGVVGWCKMTTILIKTGMIESQALKVATRSFIDGAGDEYTEQALKVAIDPHIAGGLLQGGSSTSGRLTEERY